MKTNFNEMSFTDIIIAVFGVIIALSVLSFLIQVLLCLGGIALRLAVIAVCVCAVIYGVKCFKEKFFK